jgi:hypothetical protein
MKIADYISKQIQKHPSLYKDVDYEKSKLKVLNHTFFTIGSGLYTAYTEKPEEGGYITEHIYKKKKDGYAQFYNKPYGKEKYKSIPKGYFDSKVYMIYSVCSPIEISQSGDWVYLRHSNNVTAGELRILEAKVDYHFSPYPFSNKNSLISQIINGDVFLQEDWMKELILLCEKTLEYFDDVNQYQHDIYYPSEMRIQNDIDIFTNRLELGSVSALNNLQNLWGYEVKETIPSYDEIKLRKTKSWDKYKSEKIKILSEFLDKFKK